MLIFIPKAAIAYKESNIEESADDEQGRETGKEAYRQQDAREEFSRFSHINKIYCPGRFEHIPFSVAFHNVWVKYFLTMIK